MKLYEEKTGEKKIYNGKIISVHVDDVTLENGEPAKREVVDHPGGVTVVVLTDENEVIMVRQFRYPYKQVLLETPAGKLEPGEDPFEAVKREQLEETGTSGEDYVYLGDLYPSPGYCGEIIRIWACRATSQTELSLDEDEFIEVEKIPLEKAVEMILNNEIPDAKTQTAILKTYVLVKNGKL